MGGFKKVIKRAPYKERSQPKARNNLGLLEKHKDYSLRAASFNKKKSQLQSLRAKASDRNPDEFHHRMLSRTGRGPSSALSALVRATGSDGRASRKWTGIVAGDRGNRALDVNTVRLLKTQDMGYVRTVRNVAQREVNRLRERLVVAEAMLARDGTEAEEEAGEGSGSEFDFDFGFDDANEAKKGGRTHHQPRTITTRPKKILFVDDADERDEQVARAEGGMDLEEGSEHKEDGSTAIEARKLQLQRLRRRLATAEGRLGALATAEQEMEQQRARMAKTATKGVVTKQGKKMKVTVRKR